MKFKEHPKDSNISCLVSDPGFDLYISPQWGASLVGSREALQKFIDESCPSFHSLSHAPQMGGVLFAPSPCGFDIELTDRVTEKIVQRVSSPSEWGSFLKTKLPFSYLWCAKESAWKSLRGRGQPPTISDVELNWKNLPLENRNSEMDGAVFSIHSVRGAAMINGAKGAVFQHGAYTLSYIK
jgi:phosphopantetheinyl transferase